MIEQKRKQKLQIPARHAFLEQENYKPNGHFVARILCAYLPVVSILITNKHTHT